MNRKTDTDWETFYDEGKRFLEIVERASEREDKFTPDILYNMACMSIEKLFMGYFLKAGKMPSNHTLLDLVESMKEYTEIPESLESRLLSMNSFQEICSIEMYERKEPTARDVEFFLATARECRDFIAGLIA